MRPSSRSRGTSWRKLTSCSPVQTSSLAATSSGSPSQTQQAEHEPPDRIGRVAAVLASGRPRSRTRRCAGPSGSPRSGAGTARAAARTRGSSAASTCITGQDGLARVAGVELPLELVERGEPIALDLVAEDVDEPGEAVDGAQMRPQPAREEQRGDREVLGARAAGDGSHFHPHKFTGQARRWSTGTVAERPCWWFNHVAPAAQTPPVALVQPNRGGRLTDRGSTWRTACGRTQCSEWRPSGDACVVRLGGELDLYNAPRCARPSTERLRRLARARSSSISARSSSSTRPRSAC